MSSASISADPVTGAAPTPTPQTQRPVRPDGERGFLMSEKRIIHIHRPAGISGNTGVGTLGWEHWAGSRTHVFTFTMSCVLNVSEPVKSTTISVEGVCE